MRARPRPVLAVAGVAPAVLLLAACASGTAADSDSGAVAVTSGDSTCDVSKSEVTAGPVTFSVKNTGGQVTEFYLLGSDGLRVVAEVENIGPGTSRDLTVSAQPGAYFTACKPGMVGDGIRKQFAVTGTAPSPTASDAVATMLTAATTEYAAYVKDQAEQLITETKAFAAAYKAGDDAKARSLYAPTRMHWERIEPVAESFGDLDPKLDLREAHLEDGDTWTGWHLIEKDLWPPASGYKALTTAQRAQFADLLVSDTQTLLDRVRSLTYQPDQLGNGAKELLDEVATGKVTGEEEIWSHTDLWDFQANVDGARVAYEGLRPAVQVKNPALATRLDKAFADVQAALDAQKVGDGWKLYDQLTEAQIKELAAKVDALGEPLSQLTSTVVK
ncbi:MAG: PbrT family lead (Pb2+) uptake porter [Actinomycetota bacterium]|nr:MAG: PbrT family lead (Pb2+) uptake porter [Actinomycetota bacterium]